MFRFLSEPSQSLYCWFSWKKLAVPPSWLYETLLSHQPKNSKSSQGSFRLGVGRPMIGSQSAIESLPSDTGGISPDYHPNDHRTRFRWECGTLLCNPLVELGQGICWNWREDKTEPRDGWEDKRMRGWTYERIMGQRRLLSSTPLVRRDQDL